MSSESEFSDESDEHEIPISKEAKEEVERRLDLLEEKPVKIEEDHFVFQDDDDHAYFWHQKNKCQRTNVAKKEKVEKAQGKVPPKVTEKVDVIKVLRGLEEPCCKLGCNKGISLRVAMEKREEHWKKDIHGRRAVLNNAIRSGRVEGKRNLQWFDGTQICAKSWCTIHGVALSSYYERLAEYRNGEEPTDIRKQRNRSLAYDLAVEWFRNFTKNADYMPNSSARTLPSCLSKLAVYQLYKEELGNKPVLTRSHFVYQMWKKQFPNVYIPKQSRFTKCTICVHLRESLRSPGIDESRRELTLLRKVHLTQQMTEREKYYKHGEKAKRNPKKYLSITMDGMDQAKHNLPHFNIHTKIDSSAWRLKTHVTGVLTNHHTTAYAFIDLCEWPHDSNLTVNVLLNTLLLIQNSMGHLPPVAYLQMDNCWRECKNKFVLAFLCILVEMRVFDKVKLGFLVVGHTHEDIDQMFSCVARRLMKHDAVTLKELKQEIRQSYTPEIEVVEVDSMFDVKTWMGPVQEDITGHVYHHQFKIERNGEGRAKLYYKKWSTSTEWLPKRGIEITNGIPGGEPDILQPNISNLNLERIKADLPKFRLKFDHSTSKWWSDFIQQQEARHDEAEWLLTTLVPQQGEHPCPHPRQTAGVDDELRKLLEKEEKEMEVRTVRKRKPNKDGAKNLGKKTKRK